MRLCGVNASEPEGALQLRGARRGTGAGREQPLLDPVEQGGAAGARVGSAGEQLDLLRAGAAAIWASGTPVFVLRVPERLYADPFHRP